MGSPVDRQLDWWQMQLEGQKMNVYAIMAYGHYGGGMAIVAATSDDEAKAVVGGIEDRIWHTQYAKPECVELLPCSCEGPPRVLAHYEIGE